MTVKTVLAAVDFSPTSKVALEFAGRLAVQYGATLHVLYAEYALLAAAAQERGVDLDSTGELERFTMSGLGPATGLDPRLHVVTGPPASTIVATAKKLDADVIVIGSHGMSRAVRFMFGSTTQRTLRLSDRSVLVVPESWTPADAGEPDLTGMGPIIAGVDFSEASAAAAAAAGELAARLGTELELVHAVPALRVPGPWQEQADAVVLARVDQARQELDALARGLPGSAPTRLKVTDGEVHEVLGEAASPAEGWHPLLVLGRAAGEDGGPAPGAIAFQTLSRADVPVLMHVAR